MKTSHPGPGRDAAHQAQAIERTVESGIVGLDGVLGGGARLLRRIRGSTSESATVLIRGGPGAGKSVLAAEFAWHMARALGEDVLYVCIEALPSEVLIQRMGFAGFDRNAAIDLADPDARKASGDGPAFVVGMTEPQEVDGVPDLGQMILDLRRISVERGADPHVVVVDALSDGYDLGAGVPRPFMDGVCKMAVEQGWVLVLTEEAVDERPSPWSSVADTVLFLGVTRAGRRELRVEKHRFGRCSPGPHELRIEVKGVSVVPRGGDAEYARSALRPVPFSSPEVVAKLRERQPEQRTAEFEFARALADRLPEKWMIYADFVASAHALLEVASSPWAEWRAFISRQGLRALARRCVPAEAVDPEGGDPRFNGSDAQGCIACETCSGFRAPHHPCDWCAGRAAKAKREARET